MKKGGFPVLFTAFLLVALTLFSACGVSETSATTAASPGTPTKPESSAQSVEIRTAQASGLYAASTSRPPLSREKLIAITFDDGPRAKTTERILDILAQNDSVATFFVVGYNIENNVPTLKRAKEMGCEIGNHSKDHKILTKCGAQTRREQIDWPNEALERLIGVKPALFRAPGGAFKGVTDDVGMPIIQWSVDTEDWKAKDAAHRDRSEERRNADLQRIADSVINGAQKGDIVLMHDIYDFTADLAGIIIPGLVQKGFKLVTVSEMFASYGEKLEKGKVYYKVAFDDEEETTENRTPLDPGDYFVRTKGSVLNMRAQPDANVQIIEKIPNGSLVNVSKSVPGWACVVYNSASGWVKASYLSKN